MSQVTVKLMRCGGKGAALNGIKSAPYLLQIPLGPEVGTSQVLTSSTSNQRTTLAPTAALLSALGLPSDDPSYLVWRIKNCGDTASGVSVAVCVKIDGTATPTATASPAGMTEVLLVGQSVDLACTTIGETVAIINADITE